MTFNINRKAGPGTIDLDASGTITLLQHNLNIYETDFICLYNTVEVKVEVSNVVRLYFQGCDDKDTTYQINITSVILKVFKKFPLEKKNCSIVIHGFDTVGGEFSYEFDLKICIDIQDNIVFNDLFEDSDLADVELKGNKGLGLKFHKLILANASPYFKQLFTSQRWQERAEKIVIFDDFEEETIWDFKNYVYLHTLPKKELVTLKNLLLLSAVCKMSVLEKRCSLEILKISDSCDNTELLKFAVNHKLDYLLNNLLIAAQKKLLDFKIY